MPVRRRGDKRATRAEFKVTPEMLDAFREYVDSEPQPGYSHWPEHWALHDHLWDAGALPMPLCPPCCYHPRDASTRWQFYPWAVAIYRRLEAAR